MNRHRSSSAFTRSIARSTSLLALVIAFCGTAATTRGDDWPQWLGPQRDGVWRETGLLTRFPAGGPKVLWRSPIKGGYSGPAVADGLVFVTDFATGSATGSLAASPADSPAGNVAGSPAGNAPKNDPGTRSDLAGRERVLAMDFASGKTVWSHEYPVTYRISYPAGPRATPTVHGGKVYVLGAEGHLTCLDARTGKVVWSRNLASEYKAETPIWGYSAHPLIDGQKLITLAGGSGSLAIALDKDTGKEIWRALDAPSLGYCPPSIIEAGGRRQLLIWHPQAINSLDPETGKLYWSEKLEPQYGMSIQMPVKHNDILFAGGIGNKALAVRLASDRPAATELWRGTNQTAVYPTCAAPMVDDQGILYGACQQGHFRAVDLSTGKRLWETFKPTTGTRFGSSGTCFLVRNADRWFLMSETGELIIAKLSADRYEELDRARILAPTNEAFGRPVVWSHPAFAGRRMVARNDQEIVCVSLAE